MQQAHGVSPMLCHATCPVSTPRRRKSLTMKLGGAGRGERGGQRGHAPVAVQDGARAPAGAADDHGGGEGAAGVDHPVRQLHPAAPQVLQHEAAGGGGGMGAGERVSAWPPAPRSWSGSRGAAGAPSPPRGRRACSQDPCGATAGGRGGRVPCCAARTAPPPARFQWGVLHPPRGPRTRAGTPAHPRTHARARVPSRAPPQPGSRPPHLLSRGPGRERAHEGGGGAEQRQHRARVGRVPAALPPLRHAPARHGTARLSPRHGPARPGTARPGPGARRYLVSVSSAGYASTTLMMSRQTSPTHRTRRSAMAWPRTRQSTTACSRVRPRRAPPPSPAPPISDPVGGERPGASPAPQQGQPRPRGPRGRGLAAGTPARASGIGSATPGEALRCRALSGAGRGPGPRSRGWGGGGRQVQGCQGPGGCTGVGAGSQDPAVPQFPWGGRAQESCGAGRSQAGSAREAPPPCAGA